MTAGLLANADCAAIIVFLGGGGAVAIGLYWPRLAAWFRSRRASGLAAARAEEVARRAARRSHPSSRRRGPGPRRERLAKAGRLENATGFGRIAEAEGDELAEMYAAVMAETEGTR